MGAEGARADVVICGAGMAGVSTAYFLTRMTVDDVLLVDCRFPLSLTSDKSAETYINWSTHEVTYRFARRAGTMLQELARRTDNHFHLNRRGQAYAVTSSQGAANLRRMAEQYAPLGLGPVRIHDSRRRVTQEYRVHLDDVGDAPEGADLLMGRECVEYAFPYLADEVTAVLHARDCGWFSARTLGMYLLEQARAAGLRECRAKVVGVERDGCGVRSVRLAHKDGEHTVETRCFVNAAGPFVNHVAGLLGVELPVRTGIWEKILFQDHLGVIPRSAPIVAVVDEVYLVWSEEEEAVLAEDEEHRWLLNRFSSGPYLRPEGGSESDWVLLGWAYNEPPYKVGRACDEERRGAGVVCDPQWEAELSDEFPEIVMRGMASAVPGLRNYLNRMPKPVHDGGYYVETKDVDGHAFREENPPLIGPMVVDGAFVVNACHGVSAGCAAGELCARWIVGDDLPAYADELSLRRYG